MSPPAGEQDVINNTITEIAGDGVGTNYIDGVAYSPTVNLFKNQINKVTTGMNLSGLHGGTPSVQGPGRETRSI